MSTVHTILRNRLYTGWFEWNGKTYPGQARAAGPGRALGAGAGRARRPLRQEAKRGKHDFAFSGLIACASLRLRGGRRDQEAALRLLPLHRLRR